MTDQPTKHFNNLSAVVDQLRVELKAMAKKAADDNESLRFTVESAEVEIGFVVTHEGGGKFGIKVPFFEAGAEGTRAQETSHTLKLVLLPKGPSGDVEISDEVDD